MSDVTVSDVEALSSTGWKNLATEKKQALLDDAIQESNTIYTGRFSRLPTIDGDREIFIKNLAAHKWEYAQGGEAQNESSTGGSVSYNTVSGDPIDDLQQTRFGRTALKHVRMNQSLGLVRR